ncbi:uncharacterized protein BO80DRAFT_462447 [Aspergillus ibericus CBS 121593]|uniref:Uncharacterized protein n=1 Tax=Aspergillus ibericus CBS 121593 TaxID=1448316 RepID=A0A395H7W5_9EURO|nr:hypothetical protein BO80DRAFT_462447 [Aspergillus ibericus CBS 121593]RAL03760.1 hypothetical protein BO80DRAFT_462447 [Aspergillus ibericus CBS 121593]
MEPTNFTFLNTTGASRLSKPAAKQMRAHITKTNFARRLRNLQDLSFFEGTYTPETPHDKSWLNLIASEPALIEAFLAIALLTSTRPITDGVLGAVVGMALGAALAQDQVAWNILSMGWWMLDSINSIFGFARVYHPSIVEALGEYDGQRISKLAEICDKATRLREVIESCHQQYQFDACLVAQGIEEPFASLHYEARALRVDSNAQVDATARAIELVLYLLWPSTSAAHLTLLAAELKDAICRFPIESCYYMNLTSFQLMIGAIAAEEGSLVRAWFVDRLVTAVRAMYLHGWEEPLSLMQGKLVSEIGLNGRFRALWRELHDIAVNSVV